MNPEDKTLTMQCAGESLGYHVYADVLEKISVDQKLLINTLNQYSYCMAGQDAQFKQSLNNSDILLPDGIGIVVAIKLLENKSIKKIAGADIHQYLLNQLNHIGGKCFYLGASDATLHKIRQKIQAEYPDIKVGAYSPPYKPQFSDEDNAGMIKAVNAFKPQVLFVGMTAPKQEKWSYVFKNQLDTNIICSIGAVFDFYAGTVTRPHKIWINLGLEWLIRLVKEPKRMSRRYLYYGPLFIWQILKLWPKTQSRG